MTKEELKKIYNMMLWVIPAMVLCMIGDYCMGIEPKDSTAVSGMISTGWLTIADWRIAVSNVGGLIGTVFYTLAALPFVRFLRIKMKECESKWDKFWIHMYIAGLVLGVMSFLYFHLECGTLIHNYTLIYEAAAGNTELAVSIWNRSYLVQVIPYWATFLTLEAAVLFSWIVLILKGTFKLPKYWIIASPMIIAGIGFLLEIIIPWNFNGFCSGFESLGWIIMFMGGRLLVKQEMDR
ncbi:MAG: hypothetical protein K5659_05740 [Lachnospiraceae bacterium]|nr:hypothetical protein [Lachnospiraceae bacterium]